MDLGNPCLNPPQHPCGYQKTKKTNLTCYLQSSRGWFRQSLPYSILQHLTCYLQSSRGWFRAISALLHPSALDLLLAVIKRMVSGNLCLTPSFSIVADTEKTKDELDLLLAVIKRMASGNRCPTPSQSASLLTPLLHYRWCSKVVRRHASIHFIKYHCSTTCGAVKWLGDMP